MVYTMNAFMVAASRTILVSLTLSLTLLNICVLTSSCEVLKTSLSPAQSTDTDSNCAITLVRACDASRPNFFEDRREAQTVSELSRSAELVSASLQSSARTLQPPVPPPQLPPPARSSSRWQGLASPLLPPSLHMLVSRHPPTASKCLRISRRPFPRIGRRLSTAGPVDMSDARSRPRPSRGRGP
eukprot:757677-Hanusia_phi.AAC.2